MIKRSLILCPEKISLDYIFSSILRVFSQEVKIFDVNDALGKNRLYVNTKMRRLPYGIRNHWDNYFLRLANEYLFNEISRLRPELVLVYNSEYLIPETCSKIKQGSKLVFFLGDSPFYTPQNDYYLACLNYADLILVPDTFWMSQLNTLGIRNTMYFIPGINDTSYFRLDRESLNNEKETEILYVGTSYKNSWGYKKAMLMNHFTSFNLRIYGNDAWERWFRFFPELEGAFQKTGYIPTEKLNRMFNKTQIIPVDGNPSIINGTHLRLLEALAAGALPLIEYRRDVDKEIFAGIGIDLPVIKDYSAARDVAGYWLANEKERQETVEAMKSYVLQRYSSESNADRIKERLGIQ
jgi:glycosyltransferase involved in cell wall biosynthesis